MTGLAHPKPPRMTADEFIAWAMEQTDGVHYELVGGEVVGMAPERLAQARVHDGRAGDRHEARGQRVDHVEVRDAELAFVHGDGGILRGVRTRREPGGSVLEHDAADRGLPSSDATSWRSALESRACEPIC